MNNTKRLVEALKELLKVLKEEKEVLMKNDATTLQKLVDRKSQLVEVIAEEQRSGVLPDDNVRALAKEIEPLQEINQLLTRQALSFQEEIYKALSKNTSKKYNTYSKKGDMSNSEAVNIIDQSI